MNARHQKAAVSDKESRRQNQKVEVMSIGSPRSEQLKTMLRVEVYGEYLAKVAAD